MKAEISFDLKMDDNMDFAEGTFRLPGRDWQVFIFGPHAMEQAEIDANSSWDSRVTGIQVRLPKSKRINKKVVMRVLSDVLGVTGWQEVKGPDSMQLR